MKRLLIIFVLVLALSIGAFAECNKQWVYSGPGFSGSQVVGVAAMANRLACLGEDPADSQSGLGIYSWTGGVWSGGIKTPAYTIFQGAAFEVPGIPKELRRFVNFMAIGDAGVAQKIIASGLKPTTDTVTQAVLTFGGVAMLNVLPAKWKASIVVGIRKQTEMPNPALTFGIAKAF